MKGLGLRTTYFVEKCEAEAKILMKRIISVSEGNLLEGTKREILEQARSLSTSTCTVAKDARTILWNAPKFSTHLSPAMCDNLPIAT